MKKHGLALGCGMLFPLAVPAEILLHGAEAFWGMARDLQIW